MAGPFLFLVFSLMKPLDGGFQLACTHYKCNVLEE